MNIQDRISFFSNKEGRNPESYELCPRFAYCNINKCPLHPGFKYLKNDASDSAMKEKKKCIPKKIRKEIGVYFKLSNLGLKQREISSAKMWDNLSLEQKNEKIAKISNLSPVSKLLDAGCTIIPPKKNNQEFPRLKEKKSQNSSIKNDLIKKNEVLEWGMKNERN